MRLTKGVPDEDLPEHIRREKVLIEGEYNRKIAKLDDKKLVKAPTNGKKTTRKEFQKMVEEQFGANPGGGPVIRIHREVGGN